jgi:hypothetical protein
VRTEFAGLHVGGDRAAALARPARERRVSGWRARQGRLACLLLSVPVAACSATSSVQHSPAELSPIDSMRLIEASEDAVRRRLVSRLPGAGLTAVEIDQGLNILRVALTTDQPGDYVDCGRTPRTFEGGWGGVETFDYEAAASASYKVASYDGVALEATRNVVLDARATVKIRPSAAMTEVTVDVDYELRTMITYRKSGTFGSVTDDGETVTQDISFQTTRPGFGDQEVAYCTSNGRLEAELLELAT